MKDLFEECLVCFSAFPIFSIGSTFSAHAAFDGESELQTIELGKNLFFDATLSKPVGQSCASCHDPAFGFASPDADLPVSQGAIRSRFGNRNAPSAAYAMFSPSLYYDPTMRPGIMEGMYVGGLFWDGRVNSLEEQAQAPFLNPLEMHNPGKTMVVLAVRQSEYAGLFKEIFGENSLDDGAGSLGERPSSYAPDAENVRADGLDRPASR